MKESKNFPFRPAIISQRRLEILQRFIQLRKSHSAVKAAAMVGSSVPTLWRWHKKFSARGQAGLFPGNYKSGRRSPFSHIRLTAKAVRELELYLAEQCSPRAAWRQFASVSAACPPLLAAYVRRTGKAPVQFATAVRLKAVRARCLISMDGRRLFVKLPARGMIATQMAVPSGFKLKEKERINQI